MIRNKIQPTNLKTAPINTSNPTHFGLTLEKLEENLTKKFEKEIINSETRWKTANSKIEARVSQLKTQ